MNARRFPARLLPALAAVALATPVPLLAQSTVIQSIDFSDYTPGPGVLVNNPALGESGFSGFVFPFVSVTGGAGDPLTGVVAESPLGTGAAAYMGGAGTNFALPDTDTYFEHTVFSGSFAEAPVNLIGSEKPIRKIALDFEIERNAGTNQQGFMFAVYDALDAADDNTWAYHSYVRVRPNNTVAIADNSVDLAADNYSYIQTEVTLTPGVAYRLEITVDYDHALWSATIKAIDGSATYVVASNRSINSASYTLSGWTTPGTVDITAFGVASVGNAGLLDRMYFDNLTITEQSDARFWHEQTVDDYSAYTPGRTILDGKGHIYMPWTIYANGADMNAGQFVGQLIRLNESDGHRDPTFNLDTRVKRVGYATPAPDGDHMLLSVDIGNSTTIVRVDDTGAIDPTFAQTLFAYSVRFMTVQSDGKILVAATDLTDPNASASALPGQGIYRLNADGTVDTSFTPALFTNYGGSLFGPPTVDGEGRIYLTGSFYEINNTSRQGIARLSSTGSLDADFASPATLPSGFTTYQARAAGIQSSGAVVVIGDFYYDAKGSYQNRVMAVRFNADGTFDSTFAQPLRTDLGFSVNGFRSRALAMLPDDKFIIVSDRLVKLNADGTIDSSFTSPTFGGETYWLAVEKDGTIYVPGLYTVTTPTGDVDLSAGGVGRFQSDGSLDASFSVGGWGISEYPTSVNLLSDGSAMIGGYFNRYGTMSVPGLAFFDADGSFAADRMAATLEAAGIGGQTFAQTSASVAPAGSDRTYVLLSGVESPALFRLDATGLSDDTFNLSIPGDFGLAYAGLNASGSGALYLSVGSLDVQSLVNGGAQTGTFIRVNSDGSLDSGFHPVVAAAGTFTRDQNNDLAEVDLANVNVLHVDEQDRVYVAAAQLNGNLQVARLTSTGSIDPTFTSPDLGAADESSGYTASIYDPVKGYYTQAYQTIYYSNAVIAVQPMWNGSIYLAGRLALPNLPRGLVRLTASGAIDSTFTGDGLTARTSDDLSASFISALAVDSYRRLYFAGLFDHFDGEALPGIGRLNADGTLDTSWHPGLNIVDYPQASVSLKVQNDQLYVFGTVRRDGEAYPTGNPQVVALDVPETAPTIGALSDVTVALNATPALQSFTVDDNETPAGELLVSATSSNQDLVPDGSIVIGYGSGEGGLGGLGGAAGGAAIGGLGGGTRSIRVLPVQGGTGSATITVTVSDGQMEATSSFDLTIDTPPTISRIADVTTKEDTATGTIAFTIGDDVTSTSKLTLTKASSNPTLIPTANIVLGGSGANRTVKLTPAVNQNGSATITLTVTDGLQQTATATFKVTVTAVNDAPTISTVANQTVAMGGSTGTLAVKLADVDTATTSLKLTAASSNTTVVPTASIVLGGSGANRTVKVTAAAGKSGSSTVTLSVNDGTTTVTSKFTVTVNVPPTISTVANQSILEDQTTATLAFKVADADTSTTKLVVTGKSSNTTLVPAANFTFGGSGANRTVKLKPAPNANGSATITLTVSDSYQSASSTFVLTVKAVNDAPTITAVPNQVVAKSSATAALKFTVADKETTASKLKVTATSSNTAVVAASGLSLGGSGANRTIKVTPVSGKTGTSTISVTVSDGALSTTTKFTVKADNRPTITSIAAQTIKEDATTAALAFKVADVETTASKLVVTATSSNSSLVAASGITLAGTTTNRTIKLKPVANANGSATITVTVSDGGLTASRAFKLTVTAVNDAPVISKVANQTVAKNGTSKALAFTVGDVETAASKLTVTRASSNTTLLPTAGIVLGGSGANRTVTLKPAANKTGTATVTLTVSDGSLKTSSTFTVTVK